MYPSVRYHQSLPPRTINSAEELEALGEGWEDTPAMFCPHDGMTAADSHCPTCALAAERCVKPAAASAASADDAADAKTAKKDKPAKTKPAGE